MSKLKPLYLYQLRRLLLGPRLYASQQAIAYLEKRGLVRRTGRDDLEQRKIEYAITEAGRAALEAALREE